MPAFVLVLALFLGLGGTSYAANGALPGDALYPVKIHINEAVRAGLAFDAKARAEVEAEHAERRLEEIERLSAEGKLDADAEAELAANADRQLQRARKRIAQLIDKEEALAAVDAGSRFEATLRAHEMVLTHLAENDEKGRAAISAVLRKVRDNANSVMTVRTDAEAKLSTGAEAGELVRLRIDAARKQTAEMKRRVDADDSPLGQAIKEMVHKQLEQTERRLNDASVRFEAGAMTEAFNLANEAELDVRSRDALDRVQKKLNIRVNVGGDVATDDDESDTTVDIDVNGQKVNTKLKGNGSVKIENGEVRVSGQKTSVQSWSASSADASRTRDKKNSVRINVKTQSNTSEGSNVNSDVNVNTEVNAQSTNSVSVQGGGTVNIDSNSTVNVNSNVNVHTENTVNISQ